MANIEDIEGVPGVFGGVKVDTPTNDWRNRNREYRK